MSPQISALAFKAFVAFAIYTMVLVAARRWAGQRGHLIAASVFSAAWWFAVDLGLCMLSYFLTVTAYRTWFPSEYLEDFPLIGQWFGGSELVVADVMALVLTALVFLSAHAVAYGILLLVSRASTDTSGSWRAFLPDMVTAGLSSVVFLYLMLQWESPILTLRVAQLISDTDAFDDVQRIQSVSQITGTSWLTTALYYLWPMLILFVAYGFVRSYIGVENAIATQETVDEQPAEVDESAPRVAAEPEQATTGMAEQQGTVVPATGRDGQRTPVTAAATTRPHPTPHATEMPPVTLAELVPPGNGNGRHAHVNAGPDPDIQQLVEEVEEQRAQAELARQEARALAQAQANNPLGQPNRPVAAVEPRSTLEEDDNHV